MKRISLRDIAAAAGCSIMTVSHALRGTGRVAQQTRAKVKEIAEKMGYAPDPALSALVSYRSELAVRSDYGVIAYLTDMDTEEGWRGFSSFSDYYEGAAERATQLGYQLQHIWLRQFSSPGHAARSLRARGIKGLIIGPLWKHRVRFRFDLSNFCAVAVGRSMVAPNLHRVTSNHFGGLLLCARMLRRKGYRRTGLIMPTMIDARTSHRWSAAYLSIDWRHTSTLPICRSSRDEDIIAWATTHRPDALIHPSFQLSWLRQLGKGIFSEVAMAALDVVKTIAPSSGIQQRSHAIGRAAMDQVSLLLNRNETGVPEFASTLLVDGAWHEGETTPGPMIKPPVVVLN